MTFSKLSILIPAYNEEKTIHLILDKIKAVVLEKSIAKEIVIVNDCSKDNTEKVLLEYIDDNPEMDIRLYNQSVNMGKGAAINLAIQSCTGDYLIIQDADLEYDPQNIIY